MRIFPFQMRTSFSRKKALLRPGREIPPLGAIAL